MASVHTVCACGHLDDSHQTLSSTVVLIGDQKHCYGWACDCRGWKPTVRTRSVAVFERLTIMEALAELNRRKKWWEWV